VLGPVLGSSVQERHEHAGPSPVKGHKNDKQIGASGIVGDSYFIPHNSFCVASVGKRIMKTQVQEIAEVLVCPCNIDCSRVLPGMRMIKHIIVAGPTVQSHVL